MQTCELVKLPVTLTLAGPIFTAGSTFSEWGLDAAFYRDWRRQYAIPGSHIRGKLREALETMLSIKPDASLPTEYWFGHKCDDDQGAAAAYKPRRGQLKVTDFSFKPGASMPANANRTKTRIRIDPERLTVSPGALFVCELPFASGGEFDWEGSLEFFAASDGSDKLMTQVKRAFHLITAIGADKTIGAGRLLKVSFGKPEKIKLSARNAKPQTQTPKGLDLSIQPLEPLLIGGIRRTENVFESEKVIPGTVIKGALAVGLNRIAGNPDLNDDISESNESVSKLFPNLAKHYTDMRFLHATPTIKGAARKEAIPLSLACYGDVCEDVAFKEPEEDIWAKGTTPASFQIDWKGLPAQLPDQYRQPEIEYHQVTRTAIDDELLKADDGKLYSFRMLKPAGGLFWTTQIQFPAAATDPEKQGLYAELQQSLPLALRYLGKRQTLVDLIEVPYAQQKLPGSRSGGTSFAVVLQTPALMLDPHELANKANPIFDDREKLKNSYEVYWKDLLGQSITLKRIFASQELQGGYLGMRFLKDVYRPFYLTSAGSTFVFTDCDDGAREKLNALLGDGLPLPSWAKKTYGKEVWKNCPFIPQNGYGEIRVHPAAKGD